MQATLPDFVQEGVGGASDSRNSGKGATALLMVQSKFITNPRYQHLIVELGLASAESIFTDNRIRPWRSITERENCVLDAAPGGNVLRWHVKRFKAQGTRKSPAEQEAEGIALLEEAEVPTATLVGWGVLPDGRSFLILDDLGGYKPVDKLLQSGACFDQFSKPIAELAGRLHHHLHHRDLYLCHFLARLNPFDLRLIDAGRVRRLPSWPFRQRWIVKDLAQIWHSAAQVGISGDARRSFLEEYCRSRQVSNMGSLLQKVQGKARRILRHDQNLALKKPERNVSLTS